MVTFPDPLIARNDACVPAIPFTKSSLVNRIIAIGGNITFPRGVQLCGPQFLCPKSPTYTLLRIFICDLVASNMHLQLSAGTTRLFTYCHTKTHLEKHLHQLLDLGPTSKIFRK